MIAEARPLPDVSYQLPEFVRSEAPKFVSFLQSYYGFLERYNLDVLSFRDPDLTANNLVSFLKEEIANQFPYAKIDNRKLVKIVHGIFNTKGSIASIDLLFKVFFGEAVQVTIPNQRIFRASDNIWDQQVIIKVRLLQLSVSLSRIKTVRVFDTKTLETHVLGVKSIENLLDGNLRITFSAADITERVNFVNNQLVLSTDSETNEIVFRGTVLRQPTRLRVVRGGKNWRRGQIFSLSPNPHHPSAAPTVCVVREVGAGGVMRYADIVEHGVGVATGEIFFVSPFPTTPPQVDYTITKVVQGVVSGVPVFNITLGLRSEGGLTEDTIQGIDLNGVPYTLQDYFAQNYNAEPREVLFQRRVFRAQGASMLAGAPAGGVTLEEWQASQALVQLEEGLEAKSIGMFMRESGFSSSPISILQDNFFYQLFSYVIESNKDKKEVQSFVDEIHPAGLKVFYNLLKSKILTFDDLNIARTISRSLILLRSPEVEFASAISNFVTSHLSNNITVAALTTASVTKEEDDLIVLASTINNGIDKALTWDNSANISSFIQDLIQGKLLTNSITVDTLTRDFVVNSVLSSTITPQSLIGINTNTVLPTNTVSVISGTPAGATIFNGFVEDGFVEGGYLIRDLTFNIG